MITFFNDIFCSFLSLIAKHYQSHPYIYLSLIYNNIY
ncbi:hypothetical protein (plasmid) [Staphylococcus aureus subsp. aureus N315]|uniref:Uncharacterized protein n=1 Tax=Staphylococcus aureus TaxID=1280 RepID=B1B3J5_STAAU|nr:hypothetical protein [Staphylococcus aureus subsp. aureus N315]BAB96522.1 hypothetical protein [Staphylococcus aureus]BAG12249.1 hypothetical protein [Staphylococcus aureus]